MPTPIDLQEATTQTLAEQHGFSADAVRCMRDAVAAGAGAGSMAGFEHPEFGGAGQWMRGGLLMLSDPFDHELKARVDALCYDLGDLVLSRSPDTTSTPTIGTRPASAANPGRWWPTELGTPNATGEQNGLHYAFFAGPRRLVLQNNGQASVHDTGEHRITGFSQQQDQGHATLCFTSQHGTAAVADLPVVADDDAGTTPQAAEPSPASRILDAIERLGELRTRGYLTDEEFEAAKKGLLARL